ncbi:TerC family protein [Paenibacillus assamensis]|uniref:TerC family protein n=1 Tax=Paenibacillus assamensis TaxID=311244 RepID=UPI0004249EEF|nr:TerC family protein [Paenibacillus assamensis]
MELFSVEWFGALLSIILLDLVLAGDNALVIGMAARNLKKEEQKKVIFWGTFGAVAIRAVATIFVVQLLEIQGLMLVGGLLLVWIALKLMLEDKGHEEVKAASTLMGAIRTIIIADAAMGIDNVIAVAGAANHDNMLVIIGLLISVPIVVWGSTLVIKLIDRFPIVITIGAAILAFTASKMFVGESFLKPYFENPVAKYSFEAAVVVVVVATGLLIKRSRAAKKAAQTAETAHKRAN